MQTLQRLRRPFGGGGLVAHAEGQMAALLQEMRMFDRRIDRRDHRFGLGTMRLRLIAAPRIEMQTADLAQYPCCGDPIVSGAVDRKRSLIMVQGGVAEAGGTAEIGKTLQKRQLLRRHLRLVCEGGKCLTVEAHRIVIGVGLARQIARRHQIGSSLGLLGGQAEVMAELRQMLGPVGRRTVLAFQNLADPAMKLHAPLQQEIMIDDVVQQGWLKR